MPQNSFTLYKLIILYMLDSVSFPITNSQISDFILEKGYTDFLTLQQVFSDLLSSNMITAETSRNRTFYQMTAEGEESLRFFHNKINPLIKDDIREYLDLHEIEYRNEVSVRSDYRLLAQGEYQVSLSAKDREEDLVTITLNVPTEQIASSICNNWQSKSESIYQYLTEQLF